MASVQSLEEGIVTQGWVDEICDLFLRAEVGAVERAAVGPNFVIINNTEPPPQRLLDGFRMTGDIGLHVSYSVSRRGLDYADENAQIADLRRLVTDDARQITFSIRGDYAQGGIEVRYEEPNVRITVRAKTTQEARALLRQVSASLPPLPDGYWDPGEAEREYIARTRTVFIGHGGDDQWEPLRDQVRTWGYEVQSFEEEERAGHATLEVVMGMVQASRVALIMMTAADTLQDGTKYARPNVIHELGLCQAHLGIESTIVILEEGTSYPSNIDGHIQIRYSRGELHKVMHRVKAAIEREMP